MLQAKGRLLVAAGMLLSGTFMGLAFDTAGASERLIRRCSASGVGDVSMTARYEVRRARKKFTVELEARPGGALSNGQTVVFRVAGKNVGSDKLQPIVGGDLIGELNLDTQAGPGDDEDPFPANFPPVSAGTRVAIGSGGKLILACNLR